MTYLIFPPQDYLANARAKFTGNKETRGGERLPKADEEWGAEKAPE